MRDGHLSNQCGNGELSWMSLDEQAPRFTGTQIALAFRGTVSRIKWAKFWKRSGQVVSLSTFLIRQIFGFLDSFSLQMPAKNHWSCGSRCLLPSANSFQDVYGDVHKCGYPKSSKFEIVLIGCSLINHPSSGYTHGNPLCLARFQSKSWAVLHLAPHPPRWTVWVSL